MRARLAAKVIPALSFLLLSCVQLAAQQSPYCKYDWFCLYNQEAAASDPAGIHRYSEDLIGALMPGFIDKKPSASLAKRLARAERAARKGKGKLVSEESIVAAFDNLMHEIGAPPSMKADRAGLRKFRARSEGIPSLSALFTANRNGEDCNPGEAVFLLGILFLNNGSISTELLAEYDPYTLHGSNQGGSSILVAGTELSNAGIRGLLVAYSKQHHNSAVLWNGVAHSLGF